MIQALETTEQIAELTISVRDAWNRHDMRAFGAHFTADADFVNVVGMHWRGRTEIEAMHAKLHTTIFSDSQIKLLDWHFRFISPQVGVVQMAWEMTGGLGTHNWQVPEVRRTMMTAVLVPAPCEPNGWLIAALHNTEVLPVAMSDLDGHRIAA